MMEPESNSEFQRSLEIEDRCTEFEAKWNSAAQYTLIEDSLKRAPEAIRDELLAELVSIECEFVSKQGQEPDSAQYLKRFSTRASAVREGFSSWTALTPAPNRILRDMPKRIADYQLVREIGRGGTGVVYEAIQDGLTRRVALKALLKNPAHFPQRHARFELEAKAAARLSHDNIATVFDSGEENGIFFYAMQLIDGQSISERIAISASAREEGDTQSAKIPPKLAARIIRDVANALHYAHGKDVLHRDVKPSNLLLDSQDHVYVVDFGLAKLKDADPQLTTTGDVVGTLRYLAPEAFQGTRDERADVYGTGLTLYEMLMSKPAFGETDRAKLLKQLTQQEVEFPAEFREQIPRDLQTITLKAMALDPADRYPSAREMADDLQRFLSTKPIRARRASSFERALKWTRRNPAAAILGSLLLLLTMIAIPSIAWLRASAKSASAQGALKQAESDRANEVAAAEVVRTAAVTEAKNEAAYAFLVRDVEMAIQVGRYTAAREMMDRAEERSEVVASRRQEKSSLFRDDSGRDRRGWEWNYLRNRLDNARFVFRAYEPEDSLVSLAAIECLAISPDDQQLATVRESGIDSSGKHLYGELVLWDLENGTPRQKITTEEAITSCDFSPDGSLLATLSLHLPEINLNGFVRIWDVKTGRKLHEIRLEKSFDPGFAPTADDVQQFLPKLEFDSSGEYLLISSPVRCFRTDTWEEVWQQPGYQGGICPNGVFLNTVKGRLQLHDLTTGKRIESAKSHSLATQTDFHFAKDQNRFSTINRVGNYWRLWSFSDQELNVVAGARLQRTSAAMLTPNGKGFIRAELTGGLQYYAKRGDELPKLSRHFFGHKAPVVRSLFTHSGKQLLTADTAGWVRVWDFEEPGSGSVKKTFKSEGPGDEAVESIAFNAESDRLFYANSSYAKGKPGTTGWFALDGSNEEHRQIRTTYHIIWPRTDMAHSPSGKYFAAPAREEKRPNEQAIRFFSDSGRISIWNSASSELIDTIDLGSRFVASICWAHDESQLAIAVADKPAENAPTPINAEPLESSIAIVSVGANGNISGEVSWHKFEHSLLSGSLCFVPNREKLAVSCTMGTYFLDLKTDETEQISEITSGRSAVDISLDGSRLAVNYLNRNLVHLHDLRTKDPPIEIDAPRAVCSVKFSPDGDRIALVGYDNLVYLCDANSGHRLIMLDGRASFEAKNRGFSAKVVFSPDGSKIATNALDRRITVWRADPRGKP